MQIAGIQKFSSVDYPGKMSCVVFCCGCPLRCRYCHNPELQEFNKSSPYLEKDLIEFLLKRVGKLDAVVFSGGEPLCQSDLKEQMFHVKQKGFLVGLHTSGCKPEELSKILDLVDWVGLDIKTSFENYQILTLSSTAGESAARSLEIIRSKKVNFEVRTTYDSRYISEDSLFLMAKFLAANDIKVWFIQQCVLNRGKDEEQILQLPSKRVLFEISKIIDVRIRR